MKCLFCHMPRQLLNQKFRNDETTASQNNVPLICNAKPANLETSVGVQDSVKSPAAGQGCKSRRTTQVQIDKQLIEYRRKQQSKYQKDFPSNKCLNQLESQLHEYQCKQRNNYQSCKVSETINTQNQQAQRNEIPSNELVSQNTEHQRKHQSNFNSEVDKDLKITRSDRVMKRVHSTAPGHKQTHFWHRQSFQRRPYHQYFHQQVPLQNRQLTSWHLQHRYSHQQKLPMEFSLTKEFREEQQKSWREYLCYVEKATANNTNTINL